MPVEFLFFYDNISTAYDVQKKLENLRTYFGKEYGKEMESKPRSGSGAVKAFHSLWPYYKSLMFLKDQIRSDRPNVCNLTVEDTLTQRAVLLKIQKLPRNLWRKQQKSSLQKSALSRQLSRLWKKFHQVLQFHQKGQNWVMMNILAKQLLDN